MKKKYIKDEIIIYYTPNQNLGNSLTVRLSPAMLESVKKERKEKKIYQT